MSLDYSTKSSSPSFQDKKISEHLSNIGATAKQEIADVADGVGKIVVLDFIAGCLMVFFSVPISGIPVAKLAAMGLVLIRFSKRSGYIVPQMKAFGAFISLGLLWISIVSFTSSYISPSDSVSRLVRIIFTVLFAVLVADKRIDLRSLVLGLGGMMVVNTVAFYAGIAPDEYGGYLTGWLVDKNVAGLYHAVVPFLAFVLFPKKWERSVIVLFALPTLWLTGSRTSMAGFIIAVLWIFFARKLNLFSKIFFGAFAAWLFEWLQTNFADSPVFGDRTGTDWFRQQIDNASLIKLQESPWYGRGLGEAWVTLDGGRTMAFHNSFWTLLVEGGWIWLSLVAIATLYATLIAKQTRSERHLGAEAITVILAICSWRLGEVILTLPWALAVGLGLSYLAIPKKQFVNSF